MKTKHPILVRSPFAGIAMPGARRTNDVVIALLFATACAQVAHAAPPVDRTWRNNVEDGNTNQWGSWNNWDSRNNPPDTSGERAVFTSSATAKATTIDWSFGAQYTVAGILFSSSGWQVNQQNAASRLTLAGYDPGTDNTIIDNTATSGENIIGASLVLGLDNAGIKVAGGGTTTIGGVIDDGANTYGIVKSGAGTLAISGANSYGGATVVNQGTVNVSGDQSAANGGWLIGKGNPATSTVNFQASSTVAVGTGKTIQVGSIPGDTFTSTAGQQLNVAGGVTNGGTLAIGRNSTVNINSGANWTQNGGMSMDGIGGYSASLNVNAGGLFTYAGSSSIKVNPADSNSGNSILTIGGTFVTGQGFERTATGTTGSG